MTVMRRQILIATATAGAGHVQAAAAIEEAWRLRFPKDDIKRVDILEFTPRLYRKAYSEGYAKLAEKAPEIYAHAFRKTDTPAFAQHMTRWRRLGAKAVTQKFLKFVETFQPDVVVCPHFLPLEAMGVYNAAHAKKPRVVSVITDFEAHALWMEPVVDLYCAATPESKARLSARGIPSASITVTGIPVSQRFLNPRPAATIKEELKLDSKLSTLLVLAGGLGMGPLVETLREIDKTKHAHQVLVVAGKNEALRMKLAAETFRHPTHVFGFVSTMQDLMAASDLIITKPGGLTTSEALALGKPLLIVNPLPGQEAANSDFLLEHGAAIKANRLEDLPYRLDHVLNPERLRKMARAAALVGKPQAADAVCRAAARLLDR
jgi:processive 1,2-diacylglycerol beta-glucosyltransferase